MLFLYELLLLAPQVLQLENHDFQYPPLIFCSLITQGISPLKSQRIFGLVVFYLGQQKPLHLYFCAMAHEAILQKKTNHIRNRK